MVLSVNDGRGGAVTQDFVLTVTPTLDNAAPIILSTPPLHGTVAQPYEYNLVAEDPDDDPVTWRLVQGPLGMSLDPITGALRWTPVSDQLGTNAVVVEAQDALAATATQSFEITVGCANQSPTITSIPPTLAQVGEPYLYALRATDPDGDPLTFTLLDPVPPGMTLSNLTGSAGVPPAPAGVSPGGLGGALLRWTPATNQVGAWYVQVRVSDGRGGTHTQGYTLYAADVRANHNPVIVSTPLRGATVGRPYTYTLRATDQDGDTLTLSSLLALPAGATFTPSPLSGRGQGEGVLVWTPTEAQIGPNDFIFAARDTAGGSAAQRFTVLVRSNQPPVITSVPRTNAVPGVTYRYDVSAFDPDGDALSYALGQAPTGMVIDSLGRIVWQVPPSSEGSYAVGVTVSDGFGGSAEQAFTLTVAADTTPPAVQVLVAYNLVDSRGSNFVQGGTTVPVRVAAADDVGVQSVSLRVDGVPVTLDASGSAPVAFPTNVSFVRAIGEARDLAGNVGYATNLIPVATPGARGNLDIILHSPEFNPTNDTVITRPTPVIATFTSSVPLTTFSAAYAPITPETARLDLDLGDARLEYVTLTNGTFPPGTTLAVSNYLGQFDPTVLLNGPYVLRVLAFDQNGSGWQVGMFVTVAGNLKFGEFRLEFTDLAIPVAGIPITVKRVYDSRESRRQGDFGYGWSLGVRDARIVETAKISMYGFSGQEDTFTIRSRVYLNTPDGRRVGFTFKPKIPDCCGYFGYPPGYGFITGQTYEDSFVADPGVYEKLEAVERVEGFAVYPDGSFKLAIFRIVGYDPQHYRLNTKDGTVYEYDQTAGLQNVTDPNGNRLIYTRDGIFHYAAGSTNADQSVRSVRDAAGRITQILPPAGSPIHYTYDAAGDLRVFTDLVTNVTQYLYSTARAHYLTNIIDPLGRQALRMNYDDQGRLLGITDANGNSLEQGFDASNNTVTFKDANGHTNIVRYDDNGNEVMKAIPGISTNTFAFDANNNEIWRQDGRGFVTTRAYDSRGNLTNVVDALSNVTAIAYDDLNKPTSVTDALGHTTQFRYNERGDLTNVVNALGGQAGFSRDAQGRVTSVTDFNGHTTTYDYTGGCSCGKPGRVINRDGAFRTYEYNALGQTIRETDELGHSTLSYYDDAGRLLWVRDAESNVTRYAYAAALKISETDPLGRTTWYAYDAANRQIAITNAEGGVVRFEYDNGTNRTAVIDPVGNVTRFYYDDANRLTHQADPWGRTNFFAYDAAGNRTEAIDRNGRRRTFGYDALNRRTNELWWDGTNLVHTLSYTFNALGVMTTASDTNSHLAFEYDTLNRLRRTTQSGVAGLPDFALTYAYDGMTNVLSVTDNWGVRVASDYDARSRLARRVWQGGGLPGVSVRFDYDAAGNRTNILRYSDVAGVHVIGQSRYAYNALGAITDILHANGTNGTLAEYHYQRDPAQQIIQRTIANQLSAFGYDLTGQLTNATYSAGQPNEAYHYDANGNRIGGGYLVTTNNQIVADSTNTYTYDLEGSLVGRSNTVTHATTAYRYDHRSRLVSVVDKNAGGTVTQTVEFAYDALNRRITKSVNGTLTRFLLNQENIWADADGAGAITARYLLGNRVDEMLARYWPARLFDWYLTDNLGTVRDLTDSAGAVVNHITYDSFGMLFVQSASNVGDRFLFTGREWDAEIGLYYCRARYYSAPLGRFISQDPIGFDGTDLNLYRYVRNSPLDNADPSGLRMTEYAIFIMFVRVALAAAAGYTTYGLTGSLVGAFIGAGSGFIMAFYVGAAGALAISVTVGLFAVVVAFGTPYYMEACRKYGCPTPDQIIGEIVRFLRSLP